MQFTAGTPAGVNPVSITPLHTAVAGRARLCVRGLKGSLLIKDLLERGGKVSKEIREIKASPVTGNVVVVYQETARLDGIVEHLCGVLRGDIVPPEDEPASTVSHRVEAEELAARMGTSVQYGLTNEEARERLARFGPNRIGEVRRRSDREILLVQFKSLPVALLLGAAAFSVLTSGILEALAIIAVVGLNGAIGYTTESQAERRIAGLQTAAPATARVIRGGESRTVSLDDVVPGELLTVQRGDIVAADARLIDSSALTISEAMLTGEALPVAKSAETLGSPAPLAARFNMIYRGTIVTGGKGEAIVVATGIHTQEGRIQQLVGTTAVPETVLQGELRRLGGQLVWLTLAASAAIAVIGLLRGSGIAQMVKSALSVAVAAVPEGLPMVATTSLAMGVERLRRKGVFARTLPAVETLAAVKTICFDKTGTLTLGQISVDTIAAGGVIYRNDADKKILAGPDGRPADLEHQANLRRLFEVCCLCSDAEIVDGEKGTSLSGSHTESALVQAALDYGLDVKALRRSFPRSGVQQRTEVYSFMATAHAENDRTVIAVKGSPDEVLGRCTFEMRADGSRHPLSEERRAAIRQDNLALAARSLRVLGMAQRRINAVANSPGSLDVTQLTWIGLVGMADPVRPGIADLLSRLHSAGIQTIMLTGDQERTASAVGSQVGLNGGGTINVVDAADFEDMSPETLAHAISRIHAFSRVSPAQKLEIVRALQRSGLIVAMVGDGVNDGPALRAANVGIAVGEDSAAALQIADIFIGGEELPALLDAVETSRVTHSNIAKSIRYLSSTNLSEVLLVLVGTGAGMTAPLSPMQLLWINLVTDVLPGIGLAMERPEPGILEKGPAKSRNGIMGRREMARAGREGMILTAGGLMAALWGSRSLGRNAPQVRTMTFGSLVLAQLLHSLSSRSSERSVFRSNHLRANPTLFLILAGSLILQASAFAMPPVRALLGLVPLRPRERLVTLICGVLPFLLIEALKGLPEGRPEKLVWERQDSRARDAC